MKAPHCKDRPTETSDAYQPKATLSCNTTRLEYWPETKDIHQITEFEEDDQPIRNGATQQQDELDRIGPKKSSHSRGTCPGGQSPP